MVLHRRLDYGFIGYEVPPIPRAARSIRKKSPRRSKVADDQMCAFDLLATIAGNILLEGQSSTTAETIIGTVKQEIIDDDHDKLLNAKKLYQGSSEISPVVDEHNLVLDQSDKEQFNPLGGSSSRPFGLTKKTNLNGNKVLEDNSSESVRLFRKLEGFSSGDINSCVPKLEDQVMEHIQSEAPFVVGSLNCRQSEDPKLFDQEPPAFVSSGSSMKLYSHGDHYSCGSPFPSMDNVKVVSRDDDEKRLMSTKRSRGTKTSRTRALTRDQRIRKLLVSKYWRKPSKVKYHDLYGSARDLHTVNQYRKSGFKRLNSQRIYPMKKKKKRRFFYRSPSSQDGVTGYKSMYISSEKEKNTSTAFGALGLEATGRMSVVAGQSSSFQSRESHVKVRIKSFRVPELFIELPETATVGSLKRTVLEAVTTLLGGELHVGVVLKGRKIRDDSKTLVQTGISQDNKVDGLGFTLEPDHPLVYSSTGSEDVPAVQMSNPVSRPAPAANITHQSTHASADNPAKDLAYLIKTDHDSVLVPSEISMENENVDLKAPVTLTEANAEAALAAMPQKKSKRYELGQRRIRRPFSVSEVDSLVGAVEKIGTGRWRDVKLLAFDNVEHRTYVDLKDKWKTLVHTASISPQQRRGEPVPQELLDRVLAAHGYWSEPQSKQQLEQQPESGLLLGK